MKKKIRRIVPSPRVERTRMSKKRIIEEYIRPVKHLAKKRSPKIILRRRKTRPKK